MMSVPFYDWLDGSRLAPYDVFSSGWEGLLRDLFMEIDRLIAGSGVVMRLFQVKEKFGALCVYYRLDNPEPLLSTQIAAVFCKAEYDSYSTCFTCGGPGSIRNIGGWIVPMCDKHAALEGAAGPGTRLTGLSADPKR